jgi:CubicO group peptidase (beta-lactamase class C family)
MGRIRSIAIGCLITGLVACGGSGGSADSEPPPPVYPPNDPNAQFGSPDSLLFWTQSQQQVGYRNMDRIYPTRTISRTASTPHDVFAMPATPTDLSALRYTYQGATYSLDQFIERNKVAGLLVVKNGAIVLERYNFGHSATSKWTSFSVAKSIVSLLTGAAVLDGYLTPEDRVTQYFPELRNTAYDGVTIRHLLQMSSGARWIEDYDDPQSDIGRLGAVVRESGRAGLLQYLGGLPRAAAPGSRFNYSTGETYLLGVLLQTAVQRNLSTYLSEKVWSRFSMESDAFWMINEKDEFELAGCCLSATLRDYGRIGLFALRNGVLPNGVAILPSDWMQQSTTPAPTTAEYGYLWWLTGSGNYAASGIFGQTIQIYPQQNLIIVMHSFWPADAGSEYSDHRTALSSALRSYFP